MIETKELKHVACVWWAPCDGFDFLGVLYQKHDGAWVGEYRFRYYDAKDGGDPFESKDTKNWYQVTNGNSDGCEAFEERLDKTFKKTFGNLKNFEKIEVRGDAKKFTDVMSKQPWCHVKVEYGSA